MVVLTISSIIISFSTLVILNFGKVFEKAENTINEQTELLSLKQALEKDLAKSIGNVNFENKKIIIQCFNSTTTYLFDNIQIIRETSTSKSKQFFTINNVQIKYEVPSNYFILYLESKVAGSIAIYCNFSSKAYCSENEYLITLESEH
jgi:hypothetical protein